MLKRSTDLKEKIKADVKIEQFLVSDGMRLERKGPNYKAICPFHDDHDPSLVVSVSRQQWRCHPCHEGGDVIDFVQRRHGMSFKEALIYIAEKSGIDVSQFMAKFSELTPEEQTRFTAVKAFKLVAEYCNTKLREEELMFFSKRGVDKQTLDEFQIGYSRDVISIRDALGQEVVEAVGIYNNGRWDEMGWTDTIVYPVYNEDKEIVAFHNRRYADNKPKYCGTPTAKRLQQSAMFGIHQAKKNSHGAVVVVEGANDVLACHAAGFNNTVAAMTAIITEDHFRLLQSLKVKKATWVPDSDRAGIESISKVPNVMHGVQVFIGLLPVGEDPDEFIYRAGRAEFQLVLDKSVAPIEYIIGQAVATRPFNTFTDKVAILQLLSANISILSPIEFKLACRHLADHFSIDQSIIEDYYVSNFTAKDGSKVYDQELERVIISAMIIDKECLFMASSKLKRTDFAMARHAELFAIINGLSEPVANGVIETLNYDVLNAEINKLGKSRQFDNGEFLVGFLYGTKPDNFDFAVETVLQHSRRRRLVEELEKFKKQAADPNKPVEDTVQLTLDAVSSITLEKDAIVLTAETIVPGWMEAFYGRVDNGGRPPGVDIGHQFKQLNHLMGGLRKEALILIGGDSGVGKTNIALDWLNATSMNHNSLYISAEMSENQLMDRVISKLSGVSAEKISLGLGLSDAELGKIQMAMVKLHGMKQRYACSSGLTIADVLSMIRHERMKFGIECVYVDYAQRITVPSMKSDNLYAKGVAISGPLKDLTLSLKIPIVLLVQLDRSSHGDSNPDGANVAESYRYRQDCDQFLIASKKSKKQVENGGGEQAVGNTFLFLDKNRYGRDGILLDSNFDRIDLTWREVMRR